MVRYVLHNQDAVAHNAGMCIMIDTMIGNNDGVPFTVPGLGLVDTFADFPAAKIPDFIQALEKKDFGDPGTVAHLTLKLGPKFEIPDRVLRHNGVAA